MGERTRGGFEVNVADTNNQVADEWFKSYYWKFEQLLDRIESSNNYYQILGIGRSATKDQIAQACKQMEALLNPFYLPTGFRLPDEIKARIKQSNAKIALAGSILLNFGKRVEYDNSLSPQTGALQSLNKASLPRPDPAKAVTRTLPNPNQIEQKQGEIRPQPPGDQKSRQTDQTSPGNSGAAKMPIGTVFGKPKRGVELRRGIRLSLALPVYVTGYDEQRTRWSETATTIDVSRFGVALEMQTNVVSGIVLHLSLQMPVRLRTHGYADHSYNVYGIVRRVQSPQDRLRVVGVELIGECPPIGYFEKPWASFHSAKWYGPDRRSEPRKLHVEAVEVEYLDQNLRCIEQTFATTEDVSRSGLRVAVKTAPRDFEYVRVNGLGPRQYGLALVRNRFVGEDGNLRLCLNLTKTR